MLSATGLALLAVLVAWVLNIVLPLARNIQTARASGLPYVVVPWYSYNRVQGLVMSRTLLTWLTKYLGEPSPTSWRVLVLGIWPWRWRHSPFAQLKTDNFLTVSPGGIHFSTADADVATQILSRQIDFPKASHLYQPVSVYGDNILASEGATWRHHRKLMSPVFSELNNQLVWKQSVHDAKAILSGWLAQKGKAISTVAQDTMLLSLSVIGNAGLGQTIDWPSVSNNGRPKDDIPSGHQMTFTMALTTILRGIYFIVLLPEWFLRTSPFKNAKKAYVAYLEWGRYMHEIVASKRQAMAQAKPGQTANTYDLLTQLLKEHETESGTDMAQKGTQLSDSEILGNLFVMVLAGHETSANSIHFGLNLLAMHPEVQREVQAELDEIFQGRPPEEWDYEKDLPKLLNSKLDAVAHEQLRLVTPVVVIPKYTVTPQKLIVDGKEVTIPPKTISRICVTSLHHNPRCWPFSSPTSGDITTEDRIKDLALFKPSRWFNEDGSWYRPVKGSYVPFSDGARSCLGKRFAQVEILAALAVILSTHSVELVVDEELSKPEPGRASEQQSRDANSNGENRKEKLKQAWQKAKDNAEKMIIRNMAVVITLKFKKGYYIPVRIVKRGDEKFAGIV